MKRVLIIYTGGTIGMVESPNGLVPGADMRGWLRRLIEDAHLDTSSCRYLPLRRAKSVLEEIDLPACSFSTDFARAVLFVNECYNKYTSLIMNTEYPAFHPNGNRNGSFCRPRPIQKRNQKRKKQGNMTRRMPLGQSCTRRSVLKCSDSHCGRCESCHKHCDCDCGCMCMR